MKAGLTVQSTTMSSPSSTVTQLSHQSEKGSLQSQKIRRSEAGQRSQRNGPGSSQLSLIHLRGSFCLRSSQSSNLHIPLSTNVIRSKKVLGSPSSTQRSLQRTILEWRSRTTPLIVKLRRRLVWRSLSFVRSLEKMHLLGISKMLCGRRSQSTTSQF